MSIKLSRSTISNIKDVVLETLRETEIHSLPIDLNAIYARFSWDAVPYSIAEQMGLSVDKSKDGSFTDISTPTSQRFLICYNETLPPERIRWTLAHEPGHILLKQKERNLANEVAEREAHYFAEQLLMPMAVLIRLGARTIPDIMKFCNVSEDAASWRMPDIDRHDWYYKRYGWSKHDKLFLAQFEPMFR